MLKQQNLKTLTSLLLDTQKNKAKAPPQNYLLKRLKPGTCWIIGRNSPVEYGEENRIPLLNATRALWKTSRSPTSVMQIFDRKIDSHILKRDNRDICNIFKVRIETTDAAEQKHLNKHFMILRASTKHSRVVIRSPGRH